MKLIWRFMKKYRVLSIATVLFLILDVTGSLLIPTLAAEMLNLGTSGASFELLVRTGILMAVVSVLSGVCGVAGGYTCVVLASRVGKDMRTAVYEKSLELSVFDFRQFGTASVTTRTVSDINTIQFAITSVLSMLLPVPAICVIALVLAFRLDTRMGLILMGIVAAVMVLAGFIMHSASPLFRKLQKLLDRMSVVLLENITGVRVVRAFNSEKREQERMGTAFSEYAQTSIRANRKFACLDGFSYLFVNLFTVIVYWMSGAEITVGNLQIGDITALIEYSGMVLFFLMMAQMEILTLPRALECCERIREVLDYTPEIQDENVETVRGNSGKENTIDASEKSDEKGSGSETVGKDRKSGSTAKNTEVLSVKVSEKEKSAEVLSLENVFFRFADAEKDTLKGLNFVCRRGETTAIIGGTGSGKSTIASLIMRFYDVTGGSVRLDGTDVRNLPQQELRERLSYVQQKAWLFSGTIAENLRYGKKDASNEELLHALEVAQAADFVRVLPHGLESRVAQGGGNFSGGQRQRLSIARALVKKPELYIFDDSFSALDFKTDAALRKALAAETKDSAVLIIAQRVNTIRHADRIVVLNEGEMAGVGTHEELLETCPVYQEIYRSQTKEEGEA